MKNWLKKFGTKTVRFKDLPRQHQMAVAWYNAIDGEEWESDDLYNLEHADYGDYKRWQARTKALLKKALPSLIKKYGNIKFGVVDIPTMELANYLLLHNPVCIEHKWVSANEMHEWYAKNFEIPNHSLKNRWPVILGADVIEDGWHRWNNYFRSATKIPCIFYLTKRDGNDRIK